VPGALKVELGSLSKAEQKRAPGLKAEMELEMQAVPAAVLLTASPRDKGLIQRREIERRWLWEDL